MALSYCPLLLLKSYLNGVKTFSAGSSCQDSIVVDTIIFNDSSKYVGTLKNGVPSGLGTCTWADRNQYDGEWRQGLMHGFGTYTWTSGQRYDGEWKVRLLV